MQKQGISITELATELSESSGKTYNVQTVEHWHKGTALPSADKLPMLALVLKTSTDWLLGLVSGTDDIAPLSPVNKMELTLEQTATTFIAPKRYEETRDRLISGTKEELWIQSRTAHFVDTVTSTAEKALFTAMSNHGIRVRFMVCDHRNPANASDYDYNDNYALTVQAQRRHIFTGNNSKVAQTIADSIDAVRDCAARAGTSDRLAIQLIPHPAPSLVIISDPASSGEAIVLLYNFREDPLHAPVIHVTKSDNEKLFNFFCEDYERLWETGEQYKTE